MDAKAVMQRMAELAAQRDDLECRALQLDKESALSVYTDAGEKGELLLAAEAKSLREQAQGMLADFLNLGEELLRDDERGGTDQ